MTRRFALGFLMLAILLASIWLYGQRAAEPDASVGSSTAAIRPREANTAGNAAGMPPGLHGKTPAGTPSESIGPSKPVVEAPHDGPEGARSDQDAAWLEAYGYPTEVESASAGSVNVPERIDPQDGAAITNAAQALLDEHEHGKANASLLDAAANGSIYALVALGTFFEPVDPILSQAYFRAAITRGDWMLALRMKPPLDTLQDAQATLLAIRLLEEFDRQRARRGLPPLEREVRPGLDDFLATLQVIDEEDV